MDKLNGLILLYKNASYKEINAPLCSVLIGMKKGDNFIEAPFKNRKMWITSGKTVDKVEKSVDYTINEKK